MKTLMAAVGFLTILPAGRPDRFDPEKMIPYFPVVGLLLGGILAGCDRIFLNLWPLPVASLLDVVLLAALTGAFHLDGLGDTADGLFGHHPREKALVIMKDSRIGAMGVVAIACALLLKWAGIGSLSPDRSLLLFIVPAYARAGMILGIRFLRYGRSDAGLGSGFFADAMKPTAIIGILLPVLLSLLLGWKAVLLNLCFLFLSATILFYYQKRLGCITGDMLGAMTEGIEALLFLLSSLGEV
jgi:adenosylcobinamide-GDP ribazoletransferase